MVGPGEDLKAPDLRWGDSLGQLVTLTEREFQVFMLLGHGLSNRRIGAALEIGERTVKLHVSNILRKLSLESRLQAGLAAAEHALRGTRRA